ncbi:MAG TPA: DUF3891 family protein [Candidatus Angelobacter sp.]|nr:DUF3891 family protein [Candidatus Angelobacter sp.]
MILRPLEPAAPASGKFLPVWEVVERTQTQTYESCWMITQPSHAALAGELAANLNAAQFPTPDVQILQAIALHDAGWGIPDAQAIMRSRSVHQHQPQSFLATAVPQFVEAWEKSIETSESVSPAGGYIVSRHFWRLAEQRLDSDESKADRKKLESFLQNEERRQKKLASRQSLSTEQLEKLTDLLQFCDLLSLYICCGAGQAVIFPEYFGVRLRVARQAEEYKLDPPLIRSEAMFAVAALRHPATTEESSREIQIKIE